MKEWNNPQLFSLGVENTFGKDDNANSHYCHKDATVTPCVGEQSNHNANGKKPHKFTGNACLDHGNGNSACCCYVATSNSNPDDIKPPIS